MIRRSWLGLILLMSVQTYSMPPLVAAPVQPAPPKLRLDDSARPLRYSAHVKVDPSREAFTGSIDIDLELKRKIDFLWLNGTNLKVKKAYFTVAGKRVLARALTGGEDFLGFRPAQPLPSGRAQLHVDYQGKIDRKDSAGLFAQNEGGRWYAITQFEAIYARRVFPCFDEPNFKVPWQLQLEVPEGLEALGNAPATGEKREHPGFKTVTFAETRPLPTYLVAFAIGPYSMVDAGTAGRNKVPVRIAAPYGKQAQAQYAASVAKTALELLENYFDRPYPYEKLDNVSIPLTSQFGAMENPGIVTFAQSIMLASPSNAGLGFERGFTIVATHEYAHQWFGDLVTPAFWDDIWLNESFASWMQAKIVDAWKPEWTNQTSFVRARARALQADSLLTARKIRQPIETNNDIVNAFDRISYSKGQAVLAMFEAYVGPESFRKGIQNYLQTHADGVATSRDFIAAISTAVGRDVGPAFQSFLDQPGAPLVEVKLQCAENQPATLQLTQKRFLPIGSKGGNTDQTWQIPFCVRWIQDGKTERSCTLFTTRTQTLPLGDKTGCPQWLLANDQELGYYRTAYETTLLKQLIGPDGRKNLTLPETVGLLDNLDALVSAGRLQLGDLLGLVPGLATDTRRPVIEQLTRWIGGLDQDMIPSEQRAIYAQYIQSIYGEKARALGWVPKKDEDEDTQLIRPFLVSLVADEGLDAGLQDSARSLARQWLQNRSAIRPDVISAVISIAARFGDEQLFNEFLKESHRATDREDRRRLLYALGNFRDPKLARAALDVAKNGAFDARESMDILWNMSGQKENRDLVWDFFKANYALFEKRLSPEQMASTPFMAPGCSEASQKDMEKFFQTRVVKLPGGERNLAQAVEGMELCRAYRAVQQPGVKEFFATWR